MKKQYEAPEYSVLLCSAPNILATSSESYRLSENGNGEWLEWGKIKNS